MNTSPLNPVPLDVVVTLSTPYGPLYLAGLARNFGNGAFAAEREELVLRSAWLRVRGVDEEAFGAECERLRALAGFGRATETETP